MGKETAPGRGRWEQHWAEVDQTLRRIRQEHGIDAGPPEYFGTMVSMGVGPVSGWTTFLTEDLGWTLSEHEPHPQCFLDPFAKTELDGHQVPLLTLPVLLPPDAENALTTYALNTIASAYETVLVLWEAPLIHCIRDSWYGYYGKVRMEGRWYEVLMNAKTRGLGQVVETVKAGGCIESPPLSLADGMAIMATAAYLRINGDTEEGNHSLFPIPICDAGWAVLMHEAPSAQANDSH